MAQIEFNPISRILKSIENIKHCRYNSIFEEIKEIDSLLAKDKALADQLPFNTIEEFRYFIRFHTLKEFTIAVNNFLNHPKCQNMGHYKYILLLMKYLKVQSVDYLSFDKEKYEKIVKKLKAKIAALEQFMLLKSSSNPSIPHDLFLHIMQDNNLTLEDLKLTEEEVNKTILAAFISFIEKINKESKSVTIKHHPRVVYKTIGNDSIVHKVDIKPEDLQSNVHKLNITHSLPKNHIQEKDTSVQQAEQVMQKTVESSIPDLSNLD
ncbi:MAG TPA: hypothetical protein DCL21_05540, partial [Alphaproteobacteria bacterium]|nr:hypothetical protein [Alphaproteobacteria bacterium]